MQFFFCQKLAASRRVKTRALYFLLLLLIARCSARRQPLASSLAQERRRARARAATSSALEDKWPFLFAMSIGAAVEILAAEPPRASTRATAPAAACPQLDARACASDRQSHEEAERRAARARNPKLSSACALSIAREQREKSVASNCCALARIRDSERTAAAFASSAQIAQLAAPHARESTRCNTSTRLEPIERQAELCVHNDDARRQFEAAKTRRRPTSVASNRRRARARLYFFLTFENASFLNKIWHQVCKREFKKSVLMQFGAATQNRLAAVLRARKHRRQVRAAAPCACWPNQFAFHPMRTSLSTGSSRRRPRQVSTTLAATSKPPAANCRRLRKPICARKSGSTQTNMQTAAAAATAATATMRARSRNRRPSRAYNRDHNDDGDCWRRV